jgi:cyanophycinase-like exopeptidase
VQLGGLGSAVSELSQILSQAIVLPFRRAEVRRRVPRARTQAPVRPGAGPRGLAARVHGSLWLAAGALPDEVVVELLHQVGGRRAETVVLPAGAVGVAEAGERYRRYFLRFGMERVQTLVLSTRRQAEDPEAAARLAGAELLVVGGGHPDLLLAVLRDTPAGAALASAFARGASVAFLGRAAEAVGEWCLATGRDAVAPDPSSLPLGARGRAQASAGAAALCRGLGLLPGTLVACGSHAAGRLAAIVGAALTGRALALVLDSGSAVQVRPGWQAEVRAGTVLAAGQPEEAAAAGGRRGPAPLGGVWTRVAPPGWRLDLATRSLLPPGTLDASGQP